MRAKLKDPQVALDESDNEPREYNLFAKSHPTQMNLPKLQSAAPG
jgi:hypothetical protein